MSDYKRLTKTKNINEYCSTVECGEHCEDYNDCYIRGVECKAGHEIECNNGFEEDNSYCDYDEENENG